MVDNARLQLAALLARLRRGDPEALADLQRLWFPRLFQEARTLLRDSAQAEEATYEAIGKLWDKRAKIPLDVPRALAWVIVLVRHQAVDAWRQRKRRASREMSLESEDLHLPLQAPAPRPEGLSDESRFVLHLVRTRFRGPQRRVLFLHLFRGRSVAQCCAKLERGRSTIKHLWTSGRAELEEILWSSDPSGGFRSS